MTHCPSPRLLVFLLAFRGCTATDRPTAVAFTPPFQDALLVAGTHNYTVQFPPAVAVAAGHVIEFTLTGQETNRIQLTREQETRPFTFYVNDPGSYFGNAVVVDPVNKTSLPSTRTEFSFEVVDRDSPPPSVTTKPLHAQISYSITDRALDKASARLRAKLTSERPVRIVHISDIGKMDGYKNHLLQQLIHLPRGIYQQSVVDLSCHDTAKQHFRKHLLEWGITTLSECMQVPGPGPGTSGGWASIDEWHADLAVLDVIDNLDEAPDLMQNVLQPLVAKLLDADIMMITNGSGDYDSYLIALGRLTNTKVVMDLGPRGPTMLPWTVRGLDLFVAQSTFVREHPLVRNSHVPVVTIPPVVDHAAFSFPEAQVACGNSETRLLPRVSRDFVTVAYIARLATQKGPGMFVRAAAEANKLLKHDLNHRLRFVMVGIGPLRRHLEELAERLGVHITFLGFVPNDRLQCLLLDVDVFVFSSLFHESFGMAPVEAMLMKRVVIGFGIGGSVDFLEHMKTAVVVQKRAPRELGQAVALVAQDPELRERLGNAGEHHVRQMYSPKRLLFRIRAMYQTLLIK
jgi:hypothetical protein